MTTVFSKMNYDMMTPNNETLESVENDTPGDNDIVLDRRRNDQHVLNDNLANSARTYHTLTTNGDKSKFCKRFITTMIKENGARVFLAEWDPERTRIIHFTLIDKDCVDGELYQRLEKALLAIFRTLIVPTN